uniref:Secreted protein n=1 Tax=Calcidiscus leptoporus TaxID=127549 RepID=A0A7S0P5J8_9EUKA
MTAAAICSSFISFVVASATEVSDLFDTLGWASCTFTGGGGTEGVWPDCPRRDSESSAPPFLTAADVSGCGVCPAGRLLRAVVASAKGDCSKPPLRLRFATFAWRNASPLWAPATPLTVLPLCSTFCCCPRRRFFAGAGNG